MNRETTLCPASDYIAQFTYDRDLQMLEIGFQDGAWWTYSNVPPATAVGLQRAPSRGSYFRRQIRNLYAAEEGRLPDEDDGG